MSLVHVRTYLTDVYMYMSCLGSSAGRALCLECGVAWVRIPLEAAHFSFGKVAALDMLCCFALLFV